ncbi:coenzyme A transporter [Mycoemilia scoparia]|uniref:Coenzyme A transporter n=1 Tax=Mycoemilia scoparia TaxID=417184 RepID=A0A9W8A039_9FUNG|nr:coenzyme A transporter [Mycoemilia scoparia]
MVKLEQDDTLRIKHETPGSHYRLKVFMIGGLAGCTAKTVVAPLDRVKILFQTSNPEYINLSRQHFGMFKAVNAIYKGYGLRGLFQGHSMQLARIYPYAAIKFLVYEESVKFYESIRLLKNTHLAHFLAGSTAGIMSLVCAYPFEIIRVRMAYSTPHSNALSFRARDVIQTISKENAGRLPIFNFYRGFTLSLLGMIPYGGMSFLTHNFLTELARNQFKDYATISEDPNTVNSRKRKKLELRAWAELLAGGISGVVGQTCSYPFEIVRRRQQISGLKNPTEFTSAIDTARTIWMAQGYRGFFVGLTIGYIKVLPMFAVSFYTYEKLKSWLDLE